MPFALIQVSLSSPVMIVIAVMIIVAIALIVILLVRSRPGNREREEQMRERLVQMEREAQFSVSADRVPHSRKAGEVASRIAALLSADLSMQVMAVYAGRETDSTLRNALPNGDPGVGASSRSELPDSVPASLLKEYRRPTIAYLAVIAKDQIAEASPSEKTAAEPVARPAEEGTFGDESHLADSGIDVPQSDSPHESGREVMLLPWRGPYEWSGLIVASAPAGLTGDALEPYSDAIARLTDRLAVALEFEHGDAELAAVDERASRMTSFARSLIACLEESSPPDAIVREVTRLTGAGSAALWRIDDAGGMVRMVAEHGLKQPEFLPLPVGQGLAGAIAENGQVLAVEDAPADPRCIFPREARESGIVAYLGAPLVADGKTVGVIEAHSPIRRSWSESDRRALESAAAIIGELIKSTDSRVNRLRVESAYLGLSEALQRLRSPDEVKEAAVEVLGHALGASRVIVVAIGDDGQPEPVRQEYRQTSVKTAVGASFGEPLITAVAVSETAQPVAIADSREHSLMDSGLAASLGVRSELALPISPNGKTCAIMYVHQCGQPREWKEAEIEFAERVTRQLALSLSNLRSLETAFADAQDARAEAQRASEISGDAPARIQEIEQKLQALEGTLAESRSAEQLAREGLARVAALEAGARADAEASRRAEGEAKEELARLQEEHGQARASAQQLLEINRLKSEFIVNAGHEIEATLQSVLGLAELLERGSYGSLTAEQREAVKGIYGWARRIKVDVDWLIEYGSSRSRRLEGAGASEDIS